MRFIYNTGIRLYGLSVSLFAFLGHEKAKKFILGREEDKLKLLNFSRDESENLFWFHCASLGEYDQAEPLIKRLKSEISNLKIVVTFFSPSGYEIKHQNSIADYVFYLPIDTPNNAKKFVEKIQPNKAFFVKYEFWVNYIEALNNSKIPLYILSGVFRENQIFFKSIGSWYKDKLRLVNYFFLQDLQSQKLLKKQGFNNVLISGDTRFDKVIETSKEDVEIDRIKAFSKNDFTLILGSSWQEEEALVSKIYEKYESKIKLIIVPHDVSEKHILEIKKEYSAFSPHIYSDNSAINSKVLIIDSIGLLKHIYKYGSVAFVGGGFKNALHNILEPAAFGLPVLFGDNCSKYIESTWMKESNSGFSVSNESRLTEIFDIFLSEAYLKEKSDSARAFIQKNSGATDIVMNKLKEIELGEKQS